MRIQFTRINDSYEPYITVQSLTDGEEKRIDIEDGAGYLYLKEHTTDEGFKVYSFGLWYHEERKRPGHGGMWSSNTCAINQHFGTNLYEIALQIESKYKGTFFAGYAIDRKDLPVPGILFWNKSQWTNRLELHSTQPLPVGNGYFMSTTMDADGTVVYPRGESQFLKGSDGKIRTR